MSDTAFVICRLGDDPSPERTWANSVYRHVIEPAFVDREPNPIRSDKVPTPGVISAQIVKLIIGSRVVIADMTGKNPNVYYELAIAHSFGIPAVLLVDEPGNLAFDINHHRAIELGSSKGALGADHAEAAREALNAALDEVLVDGYRPASVVSEAANARAVADLASSDPQAQELTELREAVQQLTGEVRRERRRSRQMPLILPELDPDPSAVRRGWGMLVGEEVAASDPTRLYETVETRYGTAKVWVQRIGDDAHVKVTLGPIESTSIVRNLTPFDEPLDVSRAVERAVRLYEEEGGAESTPA